MYIHMYMYINVSTLPSGNKYMKEGKVYVCMYIFSLQPFHI